MMIVGSGLDEPWRSPSRAFNMPQLGVLGESAISSDPVLAASYFTGFHCPFLYSRLTRCHLPACLYNTNTVVVLAIFFNIPSPLLFRLIVHWCV